jgi:hypothetical protein
MLSILRKPPKLLIPRSLPKLSKLRSPKLSKLRRPKLRRPKLSKLRSLPNQPRLLRKVTKTKKSLSLKLMTLKRPPLKKKKKKVKKRPPPQRSQSKFTRPKLRLFQLMKTR